MNKKLAELRFLLVKNEDDYHTLPHYGLVPDWGIRYWELHEKVEELLDGADGLQLEP